MEKELPEISQARKNLENQIDQRFSEIEDKETYSFATLLDPRFKKKAFKNEEKAKTAIVKFKNFLNENKGQPNYQKKKEMIDPSNFWEEFENSISLEDQQVTDDSQREIDNFLYEKRETISTNIFEFWKQNSNKYPILSKYAKRFLNLPPSEAFSERVFSFAGNVLEEKRTRLDDEKASQLIFLGFNFQKIPQSFVQDIEFPK